MSNRLGPYSSGAMPSARWLPVVGYEGFYEVSEFGDIRSLYFDPPRVLRHGKDSNDYPTIMLSKDGKRRPFTVHRVVALAFHGDKQNALHREVAHLDGNRTNPRADNLKWVSKIENRWHQMRHGTNPCGERHGNAKLTEKAVKEIRSSGRSRDELAKSFGVRRSAIADVLARRNWRHV